MDLTGLKWDAAGLVTVVVQDRHTGEVRMVAHANEEALRQTAHTGLAHFFSRSRKQLWCKGQTSGNTLAVAEAWIDCDLDVVIYLVDPAGPSCHTGRRTCFFMRLGDGPKGPRTTAQKFAAPTLVRLWDTLEERRDVPAAMSYTASLLERGVGKIGDKLREEADELARALADESEDRVASEAADVLYHLLVGLLARGLDPRAVEAELARRFGTSGHVEKDSR